MDKEVVKTKGRQSGQKKDPTASKVTMYFLFSGVPFTTSQSNRYVPYEQFHEAWC